MKPFIYIADNELTSPKFGEAFAAGSGGKYRDQYEPGPWAGFGSPQVWDSLTRAIKEGQDFYYGDHAYFGRGKFYRITKNAFQHTGIGEPDLERIRPFHRRAKPWRKGGGHIVVCPQSENHHERFGEPNWLDRVMHSLSLYTDRPIIVRRKKDTRSLIADLQNAHAVVVHSSNAAVEAILNGVPAFCTGQCAASILSLSDVSYIENPYYPEVDRMAWAGTLAANQWTLDEIRRGVAWKHLQKGK